MKVNKKAVYATLGASTHATEERQCDDYYATEPKAVDLLCENEIFSGGIWECACGEGHISKRLIELGYNNVLSTDFVYRGYGIEGSYDFFSTPPIHNITSSLILHTNMHRSLSKEHWNLCLMVKKWLCYLDYCFWKGKREKNFSKNTLQKQSIFRHLALIVLKMANLINMKVHQWHLRGLCGKKAIKVKQN